MSVASSRGSPCSIEDARASTAGNEPIGNRVFDHDPECTEANLSGVVELLDGEIHRQIEVSVGEHDQGRLAAEFERQWHDVGRRCDGD